MCCRDGFKYSAACGTKLVDVLRTKGPIAAVDIDEVCLPILQADHQPTLLVTTPCASIPDMTVCTTGVLE